VQIIEDHDGLKTFNSKCLGAGESDGGVIAHDCTATMVKGFRTAWIHFAGMMEEPGSFSGRVVRETASAGPEASQRMSLGRF